MININILREKPELIKESEKKRNRNPEVVEHVLKADEDWKKELKKVEQLKHQRNVVSQEINQLIKEKKKPDDKINQMRRVAADIKEGEERVSQLLEKRDQLLLQIGNILHNTVPYGKDDRENVEVKRWGKIPTFKFPLKTHVELVENLGLADFETATKIAGNGFYLLKKELGLLNQALIKFGIDFMNKKNYTYIEPPLMLRKKVLDAAIDTNEWSKTIYSIENEDSALIGTSEYALLGMHLEETFQEKDLPKKYFSYSMCFRKEVGAHGINEKGLWRTHQFNKIEQFIFCKPNESNDYFFELLKNSEEILQALKLPYRVIEICSGDLSLWKHRSYDLEVYRPTTKNYGEVMSLSNCTDYQARKLNIKVEINQERKVVHTLNNTALATSRILVGILENFQTKQGTVKIPSVLWPYMGGIKELGKK